MEHYVDKYNAEIKQLIYSKFGIRFINYSDVFRSHRVLESYCQERHIYVVHTVTPQLENMPMNYICSSEDFHTRELIADDILWTIWIHQIFFLIPATSNYVFYVCMYECGNVCARVVEEWLL